MARPKKFDKDVVLEKAMILFWKKGYYHTSIQDLVDFLGINRASLYHTFGGKKKLFDTAFKTYQFSNCEGLKAFLATQENSKEGLRMVFHKIIHDDHIDPDCKGCFIVNTITELIPADENIQAQLTHHQQKIETLFYDLLRRGVKAGQISQEKNLLLIANLLYTFMTGLRVVGKTRPDMNSSLASVEAVLSLLDD